jgi:hypothetical protein
MDRYFGWAADTEFHPLTADIEDRDLDVPGNHDGLSTLPAKDQHWVVLLAPCNCPIAMIPFVAAPPIIWNYAVRAMLVHGLANRVSEKQCSGGMGKRSLPVCQKSQKIPHG